MLKFEDVHSAAACYQVIEAALDQRFPSPALKAALAQYLTLTKEQTV